jgi:hypothetical protein
MMTMATMRTMPLRSHKMTGKESAFFCIVHKKANFRIWSAAEDDHDHFS